MLHRGRSAHAALRMLRGKTHDCDQGCRGPAADADRGRRAVIRRRSARFRPFGSSDTPVASARARPRAGGRAHYAACTRQIEGGTTGACARVAVLRRAARRTRASPKRALAMRDFDSADRGRPALRRNAYHRARQWSCGSRRRKALADYGRRDPAAARLRGHLLRRASHSRRSAGATARSRTTTSDRARSQFVQAYINRASCARDRATRRRSRSRPGDRLDPSSPSLYTIRPRLRRARPARGAIADYDRASRRWHD